MTFTIIDCEQRSEAWKAARLGKLTGSVAAEMLAMLKNGQEAAGRRNLKARLVLERITGRSQDDTYLSAAMQAGINRESDACALYEAMTGRMLTKTGFLMVESLPVGCSLDGHIGDFEGIVEIKSPIAATHLDYLKTCVIPADYLKQIVHCLWITGASWCDWLSYHPDFPEPLQVQLVRVERDERAIAEYGRKALVFLDEVDAEVQYLNSRCNEWTLHAMNDARSDRDTTEKGDNV